MSGKTYGYVRVSTRTQNEDRQLIAMREFGVPPERIVVEKQSGKDFERPAYLRLVRSLRRGDVLVVKSIDRLGRNYVEILDQWGCLTKEKRVAGRCRQACTPAAPRLACVKPVASVHPEPGSNSSLLLSCFSFFSKRDVCGAPRRAARRQRPRSVRYPARLLPL